MVFTLFKVKLDLVGLQLLPWLLLKEIINQLFLIQVSDVFIVIVHRFLFACFVFTLPDHLVTERVVVSFLVYWVVQNPGLGLRYMDSRVFLRRILIINIQFQEHVIFSFVISVIPVYKLLDHT